MIKTGAASIAIALLASMQVSVAKAPGDLGNPDTLKLVQARGADGQCRVTIEIINDQPLTGMDIPLRFGQPGDSLTLDHVEWAARVAGWEVTSALIDNDAKTVILGLISELQRVRSNADLPEAKAGQSEIAELVFEVKGAAKPKLEPLTTEYPRHEVMFFYNRIVNGQPVVQEFQPAFVARDSK